MALEPVFNFRETWARRAKSSLARRHRDAVRRSVRGIVPRTQYINSAVASAVHPRPTRMYVAVRLHPGAMGFAARQRAANVSRAVIDTYVKRE